ncbi:MAG: SIMPL domain-containing protein [Rubrivivax sp.]
MTACPANLHAPAVPRPVRWRFLRALCLLGATLSTVGAWAPAARAQVPDPVRNVMSLSASASTEVTMDTLTIALSTSRDGSDAAIVQAQLRQALDTALAEARRAARPGQLEVQTGNFSLNPRYSQRGGITGWQGRAELVLEGRDTQAVAQLAARLTTLSISRVAFSLSREAREKAESEVTAQAIARFRERAQAQAQLFGFTGFAIREVQVGTPETPRFMPMPMMRAAAAGAPAAEEALPVEPGRATVSTSISGSVVMTR